MSSATHKLFGTDGIRGTPGVYPLSDDMLSMIGQAISKSILDNKGTNNKKLKVIIGKDTRLSGGKIENILASSIRSHGIDILLAGTITTPGLAYLAKKFDANVGIMISASHNKPSDNGIKFFNHEGNKFSAQEEHAIEAVIFEQLHNKNWFLKNGNKGSVKIIKNSQVIYKKFLLSTVKGLQLKGVKVCLDCASGAAAPFAKSIFKALGAAVHSINDKPSGHTINEGGAIKPHVLKHLVLQTKSDIGVALDGDGDRGILISETGMILDGDYTLAIVAKHMTKLNTLSKQTVVGTVMSNLGLKSALEQEGVTLLTTDVGDKHVLETLLKNDLNLGGEQSGHVIFLDHLSTPDGILTALQILKVMQETKQKLSHLCSCMTKYPQILVNVKVKHKKPFESLAKVHQKRLDFENTLGAEGRILLRYSGTELLARVMVEGRDRAVIENIANILAEEIKQEIGAENK